MSTAWRRETYHLLPGHRPGRDPVGVQHRQRRRAHIEERSKYLKLGCGQIPLPLRRRASNSWHTAAALASNLAAMLAAASVAREPEEARVATAGSLPDERIQVVGHDRNTQVLRRWLLSVPHRLVRGGRRRYLRLAREISHEEEFWALHRYLQSGPAGPDWTAPPAGGAQDPGRDCLHQMTTASPFLG